MFESLRFHCNIIWVYTIKTNKNKQKKIVLFVSNPLSFFFVGSSLKVVATMSVSTDHIDVRKCEEKNIFVARTPDVAADSAAELTVALILITVRRIAEG